MSGKFLRCCAKTKLRDEITGKRGNPKGQPGQDIFNQIQTDCVVAPAFCRMKSLEFLTSWLGRQSASPASGLGEVVAKGLENRGNTCAPSMQGREILMIAI
jgi:hypothetical protein